MPIKKELIAILISLLSYVGMSSYIQIGVYTYILTFLIYFFGANISIASRDPEVSDGLGNRSVINRILRSLIYPSDTISTIILKFLSVTYNLCKSFISNIFRYPVINLFMILGLVVIIVVISVVGTPLDKDLAYENDTKISIEETKNLIFEVSNNKRTENTNYNRLTRNNSLHKDARSHAQDMARKNYVSHKSLSGVTVQERYDYCKSGENIHQTWVYSNVNNPSGFGVTNITSEEEISQNTISGWMNSKPHRENLMNKNWNSMGIGVAISKNNKVYVVQAFCS